MLNYRNETWDSLAREFSDCRLDTYYNVLRSVGVEISRAEFLIAAMPLNGTLKYLSLKMDNKLVNCPIYECIDEDFGLRVLERYSIEKKIIALKA